jgi:serine/threonine protein kinase
MPEWIGKTINNVKIEKYLARGGMAEVYLGTHITLERQVAVKVMHNFIEDDPDSLKRFQREAKVVAGLRHQNIVQIFDFNTTDGHPYIVMEYLKGPSLADYLRSLHAQNKLLPLVQVAHLLKSVSSALGYAHGQGVIHRDIKPGNIILQSRANQILLDDILPDDVDPIITDFGLVRIANAVTQTASGTVNGTPAYMSPEQALGKDTDQRTDIYSLGVILYELIAGCLPFEGDSMTAVILKHISDPPPPIDGIAAPIQAVISRALEKDPNHRYQTALDMSTDFNRAINLNPTAQTIPVSAQKKTVTVIPAPVKTKPARTPLILIAGLLVVCACLSVALLGGLGISKLSKSLKLRDVSTTSSTAQAPMASNSPQMPAGQDNSVGVLRFQDGTSPLDQITISAQLAVPVNGTQYAAWLISDSGEQRRSLGVLKQDASGQFTLTFVDPQSRNLLDGFNRMEITIEPNPDDSPNPSGKVAYFSSIPDGALMHIRHLLVGIDETPGKIGMAFGLVNNTTLIKKSADAMLEAFGKGDEQNVRTNAEAIINLIVGKQDSNSYKDWGDRDGKINDPGDGYGLLLNGDQAGYIGGVIDHAKLAAESADATTMVSDHAQHVTISAQNVETWATQLKDIAIRIAEAKSGQNEETDIRSAVILAYQMLNGIDINGNETVDPIPGEGGAITTFDHAEYMADMQILAGKDQVPPASK